MANDCRLEYGWIIVYLLLFATTINPPDVQNKLKRSLIESDGQWKILGFIYLVEMSAQVELAQKYLEIFRKFCVLATQITSTYPSGCRKLHDLIQRVSIIDGKSHEFTKMSTAVDYINKILNDDEYESVIDGARVTFLENPGEMYSKSMEHIRNIQADGMQQHVRANNLLSKIHFEKMMDSDYRSRAVKRIDELSNIDIFSITEIVNRFEAVQNNILNVCKTGTLTLVNQFLSKHDLMEILKAIEKTLKDESGCVDEEGQRVKFILPFTTNHTDYGEILDAISIGCYSFGDRLSFEINVPLVISEKYSLYHTNLNK